MAEITGRDDYIITKALAYAIAFIDELPEDEQAASDRNDMAALLIAKVPDDVERAKLVRDVERLTGVQPDHPDFKIGMTDD
jgi:hypothetical protein